MLHKVQATIMGDKQDRPTPEEIAKWRKTIDDVMRLYSLRPARAASVIMGRYPWHHWPAIDAALAELEARAAVEKAVRA